MAETDRTRWDERYAAAPKADEPRLPAHFEPFANRFRRAATAVEVACGAGQASVWLALQGVHVTSYDISPVAIEQAKELADRHGVSHLCTFEVADLDRGLPPGPQVDLVVCNMFRSAVLDQPMIDRLTFKGIVAIAALSQVGADSGASTRFRVEPGGLVDAFSQLEILEHDEGDGTAWLIGRVLPQPRGVQ